VGTAKKPVRDWTNRHHKTYWESLTGLKKVKGFLQETSAIRTRKLVLLEEKHNTVLVLIFECEDGGCMFL
jgi:hypothetical protein